MSLTDATQGLAERTLCRSRRKRLKLGRRWRRAGLEERMNSASAMEGGGRGALAQAAYGARGGLFESVTKISAILS